MREQMAAHALGLNLASLMFAIMYAADHDTSEALEDAVATVPHIIQAQRLLGDPDRDCPINGVWGPAVFISERFSRTVRRR
ncbi:hypothetical protein QYM41_17015 [Kocuria sp. CPCC 205268]|uniref:hypothetical protein n=1 Tax=Kocuria oxytropis TaxID=3058913 RepID=UPI0034D67CC5